MKGNKRFLSWEANPSTKSAGKKINYYTSLLFFQLCNWQKMERKKIKWFSAYTCHNKDTKNLKNASFKLNNVKKV